MTRYEMTLCNGKKVIWNAPRDFDPATCPAIKDMDFLLPSGTLVSGAHVMLMELLP